MTRLKAYEIKLKALKAELRIRARTLNSAQRSHNSTVKKLTALEEKIGKLKLART